MFRLVLILSFYLVGSINPALGQELSSAKIYDEVEVPATCDQFYVAISKVIKYPKDARKQKIQGKVYVEFVVDRSGKILDESVKVAKGISESLNAEAIRVVKLTPNWTPAKLTKNGPEVSQRIVKAITFKLSK